MKLSKADLKLLRDNTKDKNISFTITVGGNGKTVEEAWDSMLEGFYQDAGVADESEVSYVEEIPED